MTGLDIELSEENGDESDDGEFFRPLGLFSLSYFKATAMRCSIKTLRLLKLAYRCRRRMHTDKIAKYTKPAPPIIKYRITSIISILVKKNERSLLLY
uniref:Bm14225 n=1 Tax=Brugia malayi TaxID=6279 RepID=A0A0J9XX98_BRUMA|nr:Bm14225 [Brugia malayi]